MQTVTWASAQVLLLAGYWERVVTGRNARVRSPGGISQPWRCMPAEGRNLSLDGVLIEDSQDGMFARGLSGAEPRTAVVREKERKLVG